MDARQRGCITLALFAVLLFVLFNLTLTMDAYMIRRGELIMVPGDSKPIYIRFGGAGFRDYEKGSIYAYASSYNRTIYIADRVIPTPFLLGHEYRHLQQFEWDREMTEKEMEYDADRWGCKMENNQFWITLAAKMADQMPQTDGEMYLVTCRSEMIIGEEIQ